MKKVKVILLLITLSVLINLPIFAINDAVSLHKTDVILPYFTNISIAKAELNIASDGVAHAQTSIIARNVDKIVVNMSLQRFENGYWKTIKSWNQTTYSTETVLYNTIIVSRGYTYKVVSNVVLYLGDNVKESILISSSIVMY